MPWTRGPARCNGNSKRGGEAFSSPAVAGGLVYFGSNDTYLYALDAGSGALKWKFQTGNYVTSSPAVSDGVIYFGSCDYYIYALH